MISEWIGLDVGTSGVKAITISDEGAVIRRSAFGYSSSSDHEIHEQDAADYLTAIRHVLAECRTDGLAGIGIVGQTPTLVLVDDSGAPIRPALTWRDGRAVPEAAELRQALAPSRELCGVDNQWEPNQLPAKLLWLARHERPSLNEARWILQPKDFVGMSLTDIAASDPWSSKGLCSVATREAIQPLFDLADASGSLVPTISDPWTRLGTTTPRAAASYGVPAGLPVATGWTDALGGMLGVGAATEPMSFVLTGTSDIAGTSKTTARQPIAGLYQVPDTCSPLTIDYGPTQSSGACLIWLSAIAGLSVSDLVAEARNASPTEALFLPFLRGERAPLWNPNLRASLTSISEEDGVAELALAIMRGVALSDQHVLEKSLEATARRTEIHLGGANVHEPGWLRVRHEVHTQTLLVHTEPQLPALGAAMLARSAAIGCPLSDSYSALHGEILTPQREDGGTPAMADSLYVRYIREIDWALSKTQP